MTTEGSPVPGLHTQVLDTLGLAITAGEYPPGSVLRTDEIATRFDASRTVVREVVRVLESRGGGGAPRRGGGPRPPPPAGDADDP
ncbi:GntR family transcriptional regulator, partial [Streptomyces lavendulae]|uniref:GntR family transcriptional regulator n=1 Tax=Streptomyces lavendulae TaxID=1914 RepID=UPI0036B8A56C